MTQNSHCTHTETVVEKHASFISSQNYLSSYCLLSFFSFTSAFTSHEHLFTFVLLSTSWEVCMHVWTRITRTCACVCLLRSLQVI